MAEEERRRIPPDPPPSASPASSRTPPPGTPPRTRTTERVTIDHDPEVHEEGDVVRRERPGKIEHVRRPAGLPAAIKRVSWGAIIAGAVLALVTQLLLGLLGLALGLGAIDPTAEANPLSGLATGAGIWSIVTLLLSLLLGGYTAGRLAGLPKRTDGLLHGLVTWGLVTLLATYLLTSGIGRLLSGAAGVVVQGIESVAQGVGAALPEDVSAALPQGESVDQALEAIKREAVQQVTIEPNQGQQQPSTQPPLDTTQAFGVIPGDTSEAFANAQPPGGAQQPQAQPSREESEQEVRNALDRLRTEGGQPVSPAIRTAIVSVLAERTRLSEQEARQQVSQYEQRVQRASQNVTQTVQQQAPQIADDAAAGLSRAALYTFLALLAGALAAALGGALGAPEDLLVSPVVTRDDVP